MSEEPVVDSQHASISLTRNVQLETAWKNKINSYQKPGSHGRGWSWIECGGQHYLLKLHPEARESSPIQGFTLPGTALHEFSQQQLLPPGTYLDSIEILGHEQCCIIESSTPDAGAFRMSPGDTLGYDHKENCRVVLDYKSTGYVSGKEDEADTGNIEQINLYGYKLGAKYILIVYVDKTDWSNAIIHKIPVDEELAQRCIRKIQDTEAWERNDANKPPWTAIATGLNKWKIGRKKQDGNWYKGEEPRRAKCDANPKSPKMKGCPVREYCLQQLSDECQRQFKTFADYDAYISEMTGEQDPNQLDPFLAQFAIKKDEQK